MSLLDQKGNHLKENALRTRFLLLYMKLGGKLPTPPHMKEPHRPRSGSVCPLHKNKQLALFHPGQHENFVPLRRQHFWPYNATPLFLSHNIMPGFRRQYPKAGKLRKTWPQKLADLLPLLHTYSTLR